MAPSTYKCYGETATRLEAVMREVQEAARSNAVLDPVHTHGELVKAGAALAQAARGFYLLVSDPVSERDATSCTADLEKAADVYASWAKGLLACLSLPARKLALAPVAATIKCTCNLLSRAASGTAQAPDAGMVDTAAQKLKALELDGTKAATRLLGQAYQLVSDALEELKGSEEEAIAEAADGADDDDDDDDDDGGGPSLLGRAELSKPILRLVTTAQSLVRLSAKKALAGCGDNDRAMLMMVTCAQASSEQIDSLACAAYEADLPALLGYASSLGKLLSKLGSVMRRDCGLAEDSVLLEGEAEVASCLADLRSAPAPAEEASEVQEVS